MLDRSANAILSELQPREPIFHRADFYTTPADFDRLMGPTYWEIGASGRHYSRAFILQHLTTHPPLDAAAVGWRTANFACQPLGPDTFLLTYTLAQNDRLTRRATIWQRTASDWQILYHQGTIINPAAGNTDTSTTG